MKMRQIGKLIKWSAALLFAVFLCVVITFDFFEPDCSESSLEADYARSISDERLAKLFDQLLEIKLTDDLIRSDLSNYQNIVLPTGIRVSHEYSPRELKDLKFDNVRISKRSSRLMLKGCFDHFLTLNIHGLYDGEKPKITLNWGVTTHQSETLWER